MKQLSENIINLIIKNLVREFSPDKIILFGSYVWGNPDSSSDIDILVIVPDSNLSPVKRSTVARRCLRELNFPKDILVKTRSEFDKYVNVYASLEAQILDEGKVLYERS